MNTLRAEAESLDGKGDMTDLGLMEEASLQKLQEVLDAHQLGTTERALMIYVRDWMRRIGVAHFAEIADDEEKMAELGVALPASNALSRAIPLGMVMKEHLGHRFDLEQTVLVDLAGSRGYIAQLLMDPSFLEMPFFEKFRMKVSPGQVPQLHSAVVVDRRLPSFEEATQPFAGYEDKMKVFHALEADESSRSRIQTIETDIRELSSEKLMGMIPKGRDVVFMMNNVLYQVQEGVRKAIQDHVRNLMHDFDAPLLQMETWQPLASEKPSIVLPDGRTLPAPAFITLTSDALAFPRQVAALDGTTGKPFLMMKRKGGEVFVKKDGTMEVCDVNDA